MSFTSRQPQFSSIPRLVNDTFNPSIASYNYDPASGNTPTIIFNGGTLLVADGIIHRITISATADVDNNPDVSDKLIYLYIRGYDGTGSGPAWNLYKTATMPAASLSPTVPNPEVVWEFDGGLAVDTNIRLGILASVNYSTNNYFGDYLSYLVEYTDSNIIN